MGDRREQALRVQFDRKLRREFHGARITSDAGLLPFRELDEAFRLSEMGAAMLADSRTGKNRQHTLLAMLRQAVYRWPAGYEDVNDAERLRVDPGCAVRRPSRLNGLCTVSRNETSIRWQAPSCARAASVAPRAVAATA